MDEIVKSSPVIFLLGSLFAGFAAGFGAYKAILAVGSFETIQKGSYVLKSDIVGRLLRAESVQQLDHLIELGEKAGSVLQPEADTYMLRVHTFIHYLGLENDAEVGTRSFAEESIDHIIRDIPNLGGHIRPTPEKLARIVGVLKGIRSGLVAKA